MENLFLLQLFGFGGGFGTGIDLAVVIAFVVFGVVSFLAPAIGYQPRPPAGLGAAMYVLVAYVAVSVVVVGLQWYATTEFREVREVRGTNPGPNPRYETLVHLMFAVALAKLLLFTAALLSFAVGVRSLRLRPRPEAGAAAPPGGRAGGM